MKNWFLLLRLFCCLAVLGIGHSTARGSVLDDALPPFVNANMLTPEAAQANDGFGRSLAISHEVESSDGLLLAVGAPLRDVAGRADQGAVFLFRQEAAGWTLAQVLTASDGAAGDQFGAALALTPAADTLVVGAPRVDSGPHRDVGMAYVFHYEADGVWRQKARLDPSADPGKSFLLRGQGVALEENGQVAFVGAPGTEGDNGTMPGMVHVFTRDGDDWTNTDDFSGPTDAAASMGHTLLAASGAFGGEEGLLAAGRYRGGSGTISWGIVHVYRQEDDGWTRTESLAPATGFEFDEFGEALAMTKDAEGADALVLIGAPRNEGNAYLFTYTETDTGGSWREEHHFTPPDLYGQFGSAVALAQDGQMAAIGAPLNGSGAVHIYEQDPERGWLLAQTVREHGGTGIRLGETVALSPLAGHLFAGAPASTMRHTLEAEGGALRVYVPGAETFLPVVLR